MKLFGQNLAIGYGQRTVQDSVSFAVEKGEILALLGPNGVGKSTLLKSIIGLLPLQRGTIFLDEKDVGTFSIRERSQKICYLPQLYEPFMPFTVEQVILMGRAPYIKLWRWPGKADVELVKATMAQLKMEHLAKKECTSLSGGEQRMMLLARALVQEPDFLLLDEPAAALDSSNEGRLLEILAEMKARGIGMIMATHNPEHAVQLAAAELRLKPMEENNVGY